MNFFKSVFSENPDDPDPTAESSTPKQPKSDPNPGAWNFGGLIKTLATKSESVIETYSRDLKEFGSGLKKEIEVAQGSLGTVGHAIDEFGSSVLKGTAQIISQGKDVILAPDLESDSSDPSNHYSSYSRSQRRYSRFHAQLCAIQGDFSTFCDEPEDLEDYNKWKSGFVLEEKKEEIDNMFDENEAMDSAYKNLVPCSVDHETFWCRYFYKVHKLKQAEDLRAKLVKRAIAKEDEEELSWDVDESDDDAKEIEDASKTNFVKNREVDGGELETPAKDGYSNIEKLQSKDTEIAGEDGEGTPNLKEVGFDVEKSKDIEEKDTQDSSAGNLIVEESKIDQGKGASTSHERGNVGSTNFVQSSSPAVSEDQPSEKGGFGTTKEESEKISDDKVGTDEKADTGEPHKDSSTSLASSQPPQSEEEDLGWDEIEDLSTIDDKKETQIAAPNRDELRKRLSVAEEDEDLSWDIEDDDEAVKR